MGISDRNRSQLLVRCSSLNDTGDAMAGDGVASDPELLLDLERVVRVGCLWFMSGAGKPNAVVNNTSVGIINKQPR